MFSRIGSGLIPPKTGLRSPRISIKSATPAALSISGRYPAPSPCIGSITIFSLASRMLGTSTRLTRCSKYASRKSRFSMAASSCRAACGCRAGIDQPPQVPLDLRDNRRRCRPAVKCLDFEPVEAWRIVRKRSPSARLWHVGYFTAMYETAGDEQLCADSTGLRAAARHNFRGFQREILALRAVIEADNHDGLARRSRLAEVVDRGLRHQPDVLAGEIIGNNSAPSHRCRT